MLTDGGATPVARRPNHWDRYLPQGPTIYCVLVAGPLPLQGAVNHWGRILPQGPTIINNKNNKNSAEVDIAPAFGEITTACNVGQAKKGHVACLKSGQLVYARFHTHSHRCCREMNFISRLDVNFLDSMQNIDKVSEA